MVPHTYQMNRALLLSQGGLMGNLDIPDMERMARLSGKSSEELAMLRAAIEFARTCAVLKPKGTPS